MVPRTGGRHTSGSSPPSRKGRGRRQRELRGPRRCLDLPHYRPALWRLDREGPEGHPEEAMGPWHVRNSMTRYVRPLNQLLVLVAKSSALLNDAGRSPPSPRSWLHTKLSRVLPARLHRRPPPESSTVLICE